jgi:hypothetical protein
MVGKSMKHSCPGVMKISKKTAITNRKKTNAIRKTAIASALNVTSPPPKKPY